MKRNLWLVSVLFLLCLVLSEMSGCKANPKLDLSKAKPLHLDKGVGPVKSVKLGKLSSTLAAKGAALYKKQCVACHKLDRPVIGPALGNITGTRTPEWVMNMILNPLGMITGNANAFKLKQIYGVMMPMLGLKRAEARAILEYLRQQAPRFAPKKKPAKPAVRRKMAPTKAKKAVAPVRKAPVRRAK